ncbi:hypothetical protein O6H91_15G089000 [Diphasiastrum complanatum]|uniref:Uncharacterized protein n=1 Tax=Diphasiastrum complanatum TaxID=34168 RepID=A0ACC2BKU7_DIPCM|nr:hypothetical protein O6H91_15G089000 [Diphasiastrum complanatum]
MELCLSRSSLQCLQSLGPAPAPARGPRLVCTRPVAALRCCCGWTSQVVNVVCRDDDPRTVDNGGLAESVAGVSRKLNGPFSSALPGSCAEMSTSNSLDSDTDNATLSGNLLNPVSVRIPYGNRHIVVETGLIGRQANGSVTITDGDTVLYTSACVAVETNAPSDFLPLFVHYQERFSAAGRTSGGYFKREGKARDHEILVCRLIDRPIRPVIAKGFNKEIQLLSWVLSYDGVHCPEPLAITAAGAALAISDIPLTKAVAGVRVGLVEGQYIVNPTIDEISVSKLDMIVAGTTDAILMIEGYCEFLPEEELLQAIEIGQVAVSTICKELEIFAANIGKEKNLEAIQLPPQSLEEIIDELAGRKLEEALQIKNKKDRMNAVAAIQNVLLAELTEGLQKKEESAQRSGDSLKELEVYSLKDDSIVWAEEEDETDGVVIHKIKKPVTERHNIQLYKPSDIKMVFKGFSSKVMRRLVVQEGKRSDGRGATDIRPIQSICSILPRVHGSALFTRGETQALAVVTLGGDNMGQRLDNLTDVEDLKRFYLQYSFPPSAVGETGRVGAPSRREIGHGVLAERALEQSLPSGTDFPYTIRVESTITESNGSSSMASICGGCLALLDAGVPLKSPIAGVAMGLILDTKACGGDGEPLILSDILGSEDALGDMDFKVAGNEDGITAFQMDIKVEGITLPIMKKALAQAKDGRNHILKEMSKSSPPPSKTLSKYAPLIEFFKIEPEKVNLVIGSGGKTIKGIIEETGVDGIDLRDNGEIRILGKVYEGILAAKDRINSLIMSPTVGMTYRNAVVKSITTFGCILEIAPGREGMCHISELNTKKIAKVEDFVNVGDQLDVKLIEINPRGQLRFSHRAVLLEKEKKEQKTVEPGLKDKQKENVALLLDKENKEQKTAELGLKDKQKENAAK